MEDVAARSDEESLVDSDGEEAYEKRNESLLIVASSRKKDGGDSQIQQSVTPP